MNEVVGIMLGGAEVYTARYAATVISGYWKEMEGASRVKRFVRSMELVATGISGFAVGFYMGYEDSPNCGSEEFRRQLEQPKFWKHVGENLMHSYGLEFSRNAKNGLISRISTYGGASLSLRDSWLAVNSVMHSKAPKVDAAEFTISDSMRDKLVSATEMRDPLKLLPFWVEMANLAAEYLSKSYSNSRLNLQLTRALIENALWEKNDKLSWRPREGPEIEWRLRGTSGTICLWKCRLRIRCGKYSDDN